MNWGFLKKVVPFIATVASTAVPAAAPFIGLAAKALSVGLNKKVDATSDSIQQALTEAMASPEQLAKLKEIDNNFAIQMKQLDIQSAEDWEKILAADRADARSMQIQTKSAIPAVLAISVTVGFFGLLGLVVFHVMPNGNEKIIDIMIGSLGAAWLSIINYFFGSSSGSDRKTELLSQAPPVAQ